MHILERYGTLNDFLLYYRNRLLDDKDRDIAEAIFNRVLDVEMLPGSGNYKRLLLDISPEYKYKELLLYKASKIKAAVEDMSNPQFRNILKMYYGLDSNTSDGDIESISLQLGISTHAARKHLRDAVEELRRSGAATQAIVENKIGYEPEITREERTLLRELQNNIFNSDIILANYTNGEHENDSRNKRVLRTFDLLSRYDDIIKERKIAQIERYNKAIEDIGLEEEVYQALKEMQVSTLNDLCLMHHVYLNQLAEKIGKQQFIELLGAPGPYDPSDLYEVDVITRVIIRDIKPLDLADKYKYIDVSKLGLSNSTREILKSYRVENVKEFLKLINSDNISDIKFGSAAWKEIISKLSEYGIIIEFSSNMISLDELNLPPRIHNSLRCSGINNLQDLTNLAPKDLMKIRGMGTESVQKLLEQLDQLGICLNTDNDMPDFGALRKEKDDLKEEVIRLKARSHELGHVNKEEDKKREEEPITF